MPSSNLSDYRHSRTGSLNIPPPHNGQSSPMMGAPRFDGPRSPPNTSHVPCKFFRQGACQAGNACPFSHDIGNSAENICKYFAKGNCKFGPKCANIHVLPDGRRINYGKNGVTIGTSPITLPGTRQPSVGGGGREGGGAHSSSPSSSSNYPSTSALTNSLYRVDGGAPPSFSGYTFPDDRQHHLGRQPSLENNLPIIDTTNYSHPGSTYGSPRDEESNRFGLGLSPVNAKGLSVLDAPLPASFDSNGISNAARYPGGPFPSSVPSGFGLGSPSPSLNVAKEARTSETLKSLYNSAFGAGDHLTPGGAAAGAAASSSSPPGGHQTTMSGEEYFGKRTMHSSRYANAKAKNLLSSSVPNKGGTVDRDWEAEFAFLEEDYVPQNLQELLTPAEKARRGSLRATDGEGTETPTSTTKYGSPVGAAAASPSRWGPLFQRQKEEEMGKHTHIPSSAFGHVGSPLRNSSLAEEMDGGGHHHHNQNGTRTSSMGMGRSGAGGSENLSVLTQQLQRTKLADDGGSPLLHPNTAVGRVPSGGIGPVGKERERAIERHVSSGSIGSSVLGRFTTPIDEEDPAFVFSMEEEEENHQSSRLRKRGSSGLGVGSAWSSYAGVATTRNNAVGSAPKEAREPSVVVETVGGR